MDQETKRCPFCKQNRSNIAFEHGKHKLCINCREMIKNRKNKIEVVDQPEVKEQPMQGIVKTAVLFPPPPPPPFALVRQRKKRKL